MGPNAFPEAGSAGMTEANMFISRTRPQRAGLRRTRETGSCTISRMENARDDKAATGHPAGIDDPEPVATEAAKERRESPSDERRCEMHASFNNRISYLCKLAALVIAVVAFATIALGQELPRFVLMGLCLSVALLALAMLQDHHQRRR